MSPPSGMTFARRSVRRSRSASRALDRGPALGHGLGEDRLETVHSPARDRGGGHDDGVLDTFATEQPVQVRDALGQLLGLQPIGLVEHEDRHCLVAGQVGHVAAMRGGVGVLLRVEHPHDEVGDLDQPVGLGVGQRPDGVVVGQVEQDQSVELALALVQGTGPGEAVAPLDLQPVEQRARALQAPDAGVSTRRGRAAHTCRRQLQPGDRVEQRRLTASRASGERDHGVVGGELEPVTGAQQQLPRVGEKLGLDLARPQFHDPCQRGEPSAKTLACLGGANAHRATSRLYVAW